MLGVDMLGGGDGDESMMAATGVERWTKENAENSNGRQCTVTGSGRRQMSAEMSADGGESRTRFDGG